VSPHRILVLLIAAVVLIAWACVYFVAPASGGRPAPAGSHVPATMR
jgi:hypothetical protein